MATKTFTTMVSMENYIQHMCTEAIRHAMQICVAKLREIIDEEYYDQYEPLVYSRTRSFYRSALATLLSPMSAEIAMNEDKMNYGNYWDGETQLEMASRGYHGTAYIQTEGRFWQAFEEWMDDNAINVLKHELEKQGLKLSK